MTLLEYSKISNMLIKTIIIIVSSKIIVKIGLTEKAQKSFCITIFWDLSIKQIVIIV